MEASNNRRIVRNGILGGVILVLVLGVFSYGKSYLEERERRQHTAREAAVEATAKQISGKLQQAIRLPLKQVEALAKDPAIRSIFANGIESALQQAAADRGQAIDHLLKLRLLLPGKVRQQPDAQPPLSFASLDLLKRARLSNAPIDIELHMPGSDNAHIVLVRRVLADNGELLGLVHASLSPELLKQALQHLDGVDGYLELKQFVGGGNRVVLVQRGNADNKTTAVSKTVPIDGTSWALTYWPDIVTEMSAALDYGWLIQLIGVLLTVTLVLLAGSRLWRRRASQSPDNTVYEGAVKAFMEGAHPELGNLIPYLPARRPNKPAAEAAAPMADERDDMTDVVKPTAASDAEQHQQATWGDSEMSAATADSAATENNKPGIQVPEGIFRAYDIRGLVESELTPVVVEQLGRAIGSEARERELTSVIVGRDGRLSSADLGKALIKGLCAAGVDVTDIGQVATPVLYFATHHLDANSGVMLTGSHNGPAYNGLKIVLGGDTLSGDTVKALYQRIQEQNFSNGNGAVQSADIISDYVRRATEDIPAALSNAYKLVVDCGNGVAGAIAPQVYKAIGHDVIELYCDIDGNFPNHHPDPSQPENLEALIAKVKETGADLGFAFDGDGDRLGVVDGAGNIIWPDRQLMLLARDVLSRNNGAPIIFDVKCSRYLKAIIQASGGKPLMWKTGHSLIKGKLKETGAPLAGEMSGHIFFKERWYGFDDAIYTGARMLEVLAGQPDSPTDVFADLPTGMTTPELRVPLPEKRHTEVMAALKANINTDGGEVIDVDGLRVDYADGWGLIRPSNTSPYLVARFEAEDETALERIKNGFRTAIEAVDPALEPPF